MQMLAVLAKMILPETCPLSRFLSQVLAVLAKMDHWQFDAFELDEVTDGWPLSSLAFAVLRKCDLVPGRCGNV